MIRKPAKLVEPELTMTAESAPSAKIAAALTESIDITNGAIRKLRIEGIALPF